MRQHLFSQKLSTEHKHVSGTLLDAQNPKIALWLPGMHRVYETDSW